MSSLLSVTALTKQFGGLRAIDNVSFGIEAGELTGVIGPNGAGKTTLFNVISGFLPPTSGRILFEDREVGGRPPNVVASHGIIRTWQPNLVIPTESVRRNIEFGQHLRASSGWFRSGRPADRSEVDDLIDLLGITDYSEVAAGSCSHGVQRRLGVAIALAAQPRVLMLDEPATGLPAVEVARLTAIMRQLCREKGTTILWIEHNMEAIMGTCERILVLDYGRLIADGTPAQVRSDPAVRAAYLGEQDAA